MREFFFLMEDEILTSVKMHLGAGSARVSDGTVVDSRIRDTGNVVARTRL